VSHEALMSELLRRGLTAPRPARKERLVAVRQAFLSPVLQCPRWLVRWLELPVRLDRLKA
jgi:hypothetical protein